MLCFCVRSYFVQMLCMFGLTGYIKSKCCECRDLSDRGSMVGSLCCQIHLLFQLTETREATQSTLVLDDFGNEHLFQLTETLETGQMVSPNLLLDFPINFS